MHGHPVHAAMVGAFLHDWGYFRLPEEDFLIQLIGVERIDHVDGEEIWTWCAEPVEYYGEA
jgi:hypothetical protein